MWKVIGGSGEVERIACWDFILADDELATLMGDGSHAKGRRMLELMKSVRAIDESGDGMIDALEFQRLYLPSVLRAAENGVLGSLDPAYLLAL